MAARLSGFAVYLLRAVSLLDKWRNPSLNLRNIAIIAHVDHGKTTLVDAILKQTGVFRANEQMDERVLDSNALEKERGITILAKNISVAYRDHKINIVDTPGHADFGGEVERVLRMVDGALLVVDAVEGPMPQTRFVLQKALDHDLRLLVVVNKTDRPFAEPDRVVDEVFDLLVTLGAKDEQLDFPVYYCSALQGVAATELDELASDTASILPILDGILQAIPAPDVSEGPLQMAVTNLDYDDYVGRIAVGRVRSGVLHSGQDALVTSAADTEGRREKISQLYTFAGLKRVSVGEVQTGDIAAFSGVDSIKIGETVNEVDCPRPLPAMRVDEPTLTMIFRINDGPFGGEEGRFVTSRQLSERLYREVKTNVALQVYDTDSTDAFRVSGRGELHLGVLIETMRREGYEFCVSKPQPVLRRTDRGLEEPMETLIVDIPKDSLGSVMELVGSRKGEVQTMQQLSGDQLRVVFQVPARGLIAFSSVFLTETRGFGSMHHTFSHYGPWCGDIQSRTTGSLIAWEEGEATANALENIEKRGVLFVAPGTRVYAGMVIGENSRSEDLEVNAAKKKHISNVRAAGSDDLVRLTPPRDLSLEQALGFLADDEYLEVTPKSLRIRKALLDRHARERLKKKA